ncbi:hypothetical protein HK097_006695, partial [Rhizophlyctis rosea]
SAWEGLGGAYTLRGDDPVRICISNSQAATEAGRTDLAKIWSLAGLILAQCIDSSPSSADAKPVDKPSRRGRRGVRSFRRSRPMGPQTEVVKDGRIVMKRVGDETGGEGKKEGKKERVAWQLHPFGKRMVASIFEYLERTRDVQTLALLSCVLSEPFPPNRVDPAKTFGSASSMDRFLSANAEYFEHIHPIPNPNSAFFTPPLTNLPQGITVITTNMSEAFSRVGVAVGSVVPVSTSASGTVTKNYARGVSAPPEIQVGTKVVVTESGGDGTGYGLAASGGLQTPQIASSFGSDSQLGGYMDRRELPMVR